MKLDATEQQEDISMKPVAKHPQKDSSELVVKQTTLPTPRLALKYGEIANSVVSRLLSTIRLAATMRASISLQRDDCASIQTMIPK